MEQKIFSDVIKLRIMHALTHMLAHMHRLTCSHTPLCTGSPTLTHADSCTCSHMLTLAHTHRLTCSHHGKTETGVMLPQAKMPRATGSWGSEGRILL